jgi:uncharacterized membrane protein
METVLLIAILAMQVTTFLGMVGFFLQLNSRIDKLWGAVANLGERVAQLEEPIDRLSERL